MEDGAGTRGERGSTLTVPRPRATPSATTATRRTARLSTRLAAPAGRWPGLVRRIRRARPSPFVATWMARLVALTGVVDLIGAVVPPNRMRVRLVAEVWPLIGIQVAHAATAAVGLLLIFLGSGLRRRKRNAWFVATALTATSVALNLVKGLDVDGAALSAVLLAMLWATRGEFRAQADPASRWRALAALVGFGAAGFGLGLVEVALRSERLVGDPPPMQWVI